MCHPRSSISPGTVAALLCAGAALAVGSRAAHAAPADAPVAVDELPARWRTGAPLGGDRSGDLRAAVVAIEDAAARAAAQQRVLTLADLRALGLAGAGGAWPARVWASGAPTTVAFAAPATIKVWRRGVDGSTASCSGRVDVIPFERYVKGVLPHEWIRSWNRASLEAGAIAIRTYAAYWVEAGGKYDCADLDDTTASQVYEDEFFAVTDDAVDATRNVFASRGGALVFAEYSAENGDPTAMNVSEPLCTGRARMGHGRGTCQWGSQRWAQDGKGADWIVTHYYPGSTLVDLTPPPPEEPDAGTGTGDGDAGVDPALEGGGASGGCASGGGRAGLGLVLGLGLAGLLGGRLRRRAPLAVLALAAAAAGSAPLHGCAPPADPEPRAVTAVGGASELAPIFRQVADESGVPASILAAVAYSETRLSMIAPDDDGHAHGPPAWGLFALTDVDGVRAIERAAALAGVTPAQARTEPRSTTRAAAALLADLAASSGNRTPATLAGWRDALVAFGGGGHAGAGFADQVLASIARGVSGRDDAGARLVIAARPEARAAGGLGTVSLALGYPGALWNPAYSGNYQAASRGADQINEIIIHTTQGSYAGTISWFKNPSAQVSAHYVVRSADGQITQMVDDSDVAWHDGCNNSDTIGIEHEGFVDDPGRWYTDAMYLESARLTAWLCDQYGVPKVHGDVGGTSAGIRGHGEANDCSSHTDPGSGWNWTRYMDLVRTGGAAQFGASATASDYPREMTSGDEAVVWFELKNESSITWGIDATRLGTAEPQDRASPFFVDGNWLSPSRPTGADHSNYDPGTVGRFTFAIKAPVVATTTTFHEAFQLVQEGVQWFGPVVSMDITVHPVGGDPVEPDASPDDPPASEQSGGCAIVGARAGAGGGAGALACAILVGGVVLPRRRRVA
jgi:hypothetical protein